MRKLSVWILIAFALVYFVGSEGSHSPNNVAVPTVTGQSQSVITQVDQAAYAYVTGTRVNQRKGRGTSYPVMGQLTQATRVRLVSDDGEWSQIVSSLGNGWMSSRYLSKNRPTVTKPAPAQPTRNVAVPSSREIQAAKQAIIRQSISAYPGSCPCPFNRDRAGRRCGKRSAWSRPGGYSPICYESDVSRSRLNSYFARQRGAAN